MEATVINDIELDEVEDAEFIETMRLLDELSSGEMEHKFNEIIDFLKELYFQEDKEWIVTYSGGKDSSLVLLLVFKMLLSLPKEDRFKRIHVVSADTKVESYQMTTYLKKNLALIKQFEEELNLEVHLVVPDLKNSYFWNVIGRGVVAPKPPSPFQWCTKKLKINAMNRMLDEILAKAPIDLSGNFTEYGIEIKDNKNNVTIEDKTYDAMMLLGSRLDESAKRARSINKYSLNKQEVFGRNPDYKNIRMCYPIKFIKTSDLWTYITRHEYLPWGLPSMELFEMYSDGSGECPITREELAETKGCGSTNSRNGCWVCLYAGREDKMLNTLISSGHTGVQYMAEWKAYLYDVTYDVRYREPLRRLEVNRNEKKIKAGKIETMDLFSLLEEDEDRSNYLNYERAKKTHYEPGGFTFELRLKLLQKLLYTQKMSGYELIEQEELDAILKTWKEEGYYFTEEDIRPVNHQYDGQVVLKQDGKVNKKETKNKNKIFFVPYEFKLGETELINYFKGRQKITGKSYYCFFDNKDYEKNLFTFNFLKFIVCEEGVNTQEKANYVIFKWLYKEGKPESRNKMEKASYKLGVDSLLLKAIDEGLQMLN